MKKVLTLLVLALICELARGTDALPPIDMTGFGSSSPDLCKAMREKHLTQQDLWSTQEFSSRDWVLAHRDIADFERGIKDGFWRNMHRYSTIAQTGLKLDWSRFGAVKVVLESELRSNNVITLAFRSDHEGTPRRSYFYFEIPLDFAGQKEFQFNFSAARTINRPFSWGRIDGIYLFAKANGHRPNPYAALKLVSLTPIAGNQAAAEPPAGEAEPYRLGLPDRPSPNLNHHWPEHAATGPVVDDHSFITYQHHGRNEWDLFAYYPRYNPGYLSFSPDGRAHIAAGDLLQWLDDDGRWQAISLRPHLEKWARSKSYGGIYHSWGSYGNESTIRFDRYGNSYWLIRVEPLGRDGRRGDWRKRTALLLFSPDRFRTVKIYELSKPIASFEKVDGNNPAALDRPPVIMLSDFSYFPEADHRLSWVQPELRDGELTIKPPVEVAEVAIGCCYHSGDGNIVLSSRDRIFVIWGWAPNSGNRVSRIALEELKKQFPEEPDLGKRWTVDDLRRTSLGRTLPPVPPATAPERSFRFDTLYHYDYHSRFLPADSRDGVPTFITTFDRETGKKLNTVYLGSAGMSLDDHNWGAISFSPEGFIEVIINGHHNPPLYTRSLKPYSADAFEPVRPIRPEQGFERCSYGSLNCDAGGTLYSIHRSTTGTANNRLVLFRKKPGGAWEPAKTIAAPSKMLYYSWSHKVAINSRTGHLFLVYLGNPGQSFWTPDYYEAMRFIYPELEELLTMRNRDERRMELRTVRFWESWQVGDIVNLPAGEPVILSSKDGGGSWELATTAALAAERKEGAAKFVP